MHSRCGALGARKEITRRQLLLYAPSLAVVTSCKPSQHHRTLGPSTSVQPKQSQTSAAFTMSFAPAFPGNHELQPLPFNPAKVAGLSERLITSHYQNNYGGAVRNLNRVAQELSQTNKDTPPLLVTALREHELTFRNSKALHEAHFGNLGGDGKVASPVERALAQTYGSVARWEEHFRLTALGLGGGSGWAIVGFELKSGALRVFSSGNHKEGLASSVSLLVLDMYEHSYHLDFGAAAAKYVDAFWQNINWDEVARRLEDARAIRNALLKP